MKKNKRLLSTFAILILIAAIAFGVWYQFFRVADNSFLKVKEKGVLVVGMEIPFGVMEFFDENNQPAGIDIDIAKEIASRLGVELSINNLSWEKIFSKVQGGEIDLAISSITITSERKEEVLFSVPYFNGGQVIITLSENNTIGGVSDLENKRIVAQEGTTSFFEAKKYTTEDLICIDKNFNTSIGGEKVFEDLKNNQLDAVIVDYVKALEIIKKYPGLKIIGVPFTQEEYGIATKIGNETLIKKINSILIEMEKDGTMRKIEEKWIKF